MPITDFLERNAKKFGEKTALVEINPDVKEIRRVTWKEYELIEPSPTESFRHDITWGVFNEKANRCANLLAIRGIKKGDKVAILMMNSLEWLPIYFGILKAGAVAVPLNFRYTAGEIKYCLERAEVKALFFGSEFIGRVEQICGSVPKLKLLFYTGDTCPRFAESYLYLTANIASTVRRVEITDRDDAAIYFSSGTTGFPKAILHNHESLMHAALTEQNHHGQKEDDIFLCIPPLYHTGAKMHWFGSLITGGTGVLLRGTNPVSIIKAVSDEKCTIVWLLVPWVQDILDAIESGELDLNDYELSQWRLMHIGAQPVPPSLIERWHKVFPHHLYDTNYGLSESTGPGCVHLGTGNIHKVGAIGIPGYGWKARVVDESRNPVPDGTIGELEVCGPGVMTCYYNDPKATAEVLHDGCLLTGDMARVDEDGFIYLVDRKKDVIISGGENIYPVQVEDFLRAHPDIKDAAVIGLPDKRLGEIAAAIIELKEGRGVTAEELADYCLELPRYKRPRKIILDKIPRNPTGKIEKPKLRQKYRAENLVEMQTEG